MADATPFGYARVIVNASGAFIDNNADGKLDDADKVGGALIAANYGAGGNADLAAKRVVITSHNLPLASQATYLAGLTSNDRVKLDIASANYGNLADLKWIANDANSWLQAMQAQGLKSDVSITANGLGGTARLSVGRLPEVDSTQGVIAPLGSLSILAVGGRNGVAGSDASLVIGLGSTGQGGVIGPVRVQAAGVGSRATLTAISNSAVTTRDVAVVATGYGATASGVIRSSADKGLTSGALSAASYADASQTNLSVAAGTGGAEAASLSTLAGGAGTMSMLNFVATSGGARIGASTGGAFTYGDVQAVASGSFLRPTGKGSISQLTASAEGGNLVVGAVKVRATGAVSDASVVLQADAGTVQLAGPVTVDAWGNLSKATLTVTGHASSGATAVQMGGLWQSASGGGARASTELFASGGSIKVNGNIGTLASGGSANSKLRIDTNDASIVVQGDWTQSASGYGVHADTEIKHQGTTGGTGSSLLDISGSVKMQVSGMNSGTAMHLLPAPSSTGGIQTKEIRLSAAASQSLPDNQIDLSLVSREGGFSSSSGLHATSSGVGAKIDATLGSDAGPVSLNSWYQSALGNSSTVNTRLVGGNELIIDREINIEAVGTFAQSRLNLNTTGPLSVSSPSSSQPPSPALTIKSALYGSKAQALLDIGPEDLILNGGLLVSRSGAAEMTADANAHAELFIQKSGATGNIIIDGPVLLTADTSATNGTVAARIKSASGLINTGQVVTSSRAFNSHVIFDVEMSGEPQGDAT